MSEFTPCNLRTLKDMQRRHGGRVRVVPVPARPAIAVTTRTTAAAPTVPPQERTKAMGDEHHDHVPVSGSQPLTPRAASAFAARLIEAARIADLGNGVGP